MTHEQLWAPWRMAYILESKDAPPAAEEGCFLCRGLGESRVRENFIVSRGERTVVVLNRYPYNNGHLLIAPKAHKAALLDLDDDEMLECMQTLQKLTAVYERLMRPDGFNIGLNLGRAAGAGLPGHLHWHLVPRWSGDTSFMSVIDAVRVISQSLEALYELLTEAISDARN